MRATCLTVAVLTAGCGVMGGGSANGQSDKKPTDKESNDTSATRPEKLNPSGLAQARTADAPRFELSADGEILPNFMGPRITFKDGGPDDIPQDRAGLLKSAKKAIGEGNIDYALAIIDVLHLMHPNDPEILELRGDAMMEQGLEEDAMVDLDKCCSLGRSSCCR